jgi:glycosyltransferase involved in cell wall biosynthesis
MTVSVAIATYNRAAMIREAVAAALAQSLAPAEVVVADDASSDQTWPVLEALARKHPAVRVFRRRENSGGVENWNFAIRQTRGEYIAWCSDDDCFLPGHLEASVAYLETHAEIGLVHGGFVDSIETAGETRREPRPLRFRADRILSRRDLMRYAVRYYDWPFHPSTVVMRRAVWEQAGEFDPRWALADTDWFVRVVERFPVAMLARHGVLNRRHAGNWSNRLGSARMQREIFEIVEGAIERLTSGHAVKRMFWRALWRANVRARLALTLWARFKTGHADAACAAWETLARDTRRRAPDALIRCGAALIRRGARRWASPVAGHSASPL